MKLNLVLGVIGSGKTWYSEKILAGEVIYLADTLREQAWRVLGYTPQSPEDYESFKKSSIIGNVTGRDILQRLADEIKRVDKDYYVKQATDKIKKSKSTSITIPDVRFMFELDSFKEFNPSIYFCNYHSKRYDARNNHPSEKLAQKIIEYHKVPHLDYPMELTRLEVYLADLRGQ